MSHVGILCRSVAAAVAALFITIPDTLPKAAQMDAPAVLPEPAICRGSEGRLSALTVKAAMAAYSTGLQTADAAASSVEMEDNLDLFEKLGLMEGHLLIGKALLDAKMQDAALPHFGHPISELYDYLKPVFAERHYPEFEADLRALERHAKDEPNAPVTTASFDDVMTKIDGLRKTTPEGFRKSADFVTLGIALLLDDAAGDLGESLDKGKIVNTIEYHDAMGFARYADNAVKKYRDVLGQRADAIAKETAFTLTAFPALAAPDRPKRSVANLHTAADRVKTIAGHHTTTPHAG
jgi:hypothetical protein